MGRLEKYREGVQSLKTPPSVLMYKKEILSRSQAPLSIQEATPACSPLPPARLLKQIRASNDVKTSREKITAGYCCGITKARCDSKLKKPDLRRSFINYNYGRRGFAY